MIRQLEQKDIEKVALVHMLSWQTAFKNILSDNLLDNLAKEEFVMTWGQTIQKTDRQNLVYILGNSPTAFISFGPTEESEEIAEIYGIYVEPEYWRHGHGKLLMEKAINLLITSRQYSKLILWVMTKTSLQGSSMKN